MTGRERLEAAFSRDGAAGIPAVLCYEGIYIRDSWRDVSTRPWWYRAAPDVARQRAWRLEVAERLGQDWYQLPECLPRAERERLWIDQRGDEVVLVDDDNGTEEILREPPVGGWHLDGGSESAHPAAPPDSPGQVDEQLGVHDEGGDAQALEAEPDGRLDLAAALRAARPDLLPYAAVTSPFWGCYRLWGYEGLMLRAAIDPDLVAHACGRLADRAAADVAAAAARGAAAIWIEECFTDALHPDTFARLHLPHLRRVTEAVTAAGLRSVYYYCGDPAGKWDLLLDAGADALSLEESKKGFAIDIDDVVARVAGRCTVFGNLDAVGVLQDGTDGDLRAEIERQLAAGRRHGRRFVMSLGSPVTPGTPAARVRLYCDMVRERGAA
jgi:hypothetical protein